MLSNYLLTLTLSLLAANISPVSGAAVVDLSFHSHPSHELKSESGQYDRQAALSILSPSTISPTLTLQARPTTVYRPRSLAALHQARLRSLRFGESEKVEWDRVEVLGPDIENKHTVSQLARMTGNAYALPGQKNWYEVDLAWNTVRSIPSHPFQ